MHSCALRSLEGRPFSAVPAPFETTRLDVVSSRTRVFTYCFHLRSYLCGGITLISGQATPDSWPEVIAFQASDGDSDTDGPLEAYTGINARDYAGLSCIAWRFEGDALLVDLLNHQDGCGIPHGGEVMQTGDAVHLQLTNPECISPNCGSRFYSWSFVVRPVHRDVTTLIAENTGCPTWDYGTREHIRADVSLGNTDSGM